jgi:NADH-quinone oxidoreductase subunit J
MINDAIYTLLFYFFSVFAVIFALAVTMSRRMLRAAVYLMMVLLASACMYVMLGAEFLAGIQVLVYVGGIVVLIVFAIMLTRSAELPLDKPPVHRKISAGLVSILFAAATVWIFWSSEFTLAQSGAALPQDNVKQIGLKLLDYGKDGYILPFEIISLLLLAAIIGGIVVARKTPPPNQPFTTRGDLTGETNFYLPHTQRPQTRTERQP